MNGRRGGRLVRLCLDGRCWGERTRKWRRVRGLCRRVGRRYGERFRAHGVVELSGTRGAVCVRLCVGERAKRVDVFCDEELAHLIAVTRQVVARHAEILEELGYWRDGVFWICGKLIHLDVCLDVGGREEGACEGGDEGMVNKPLSIHTL